jgi:hypothetical protein
MTLVDLDGCIDADGTISAEATRLIAALDSYTERSVSGTGIHILVRGLPPEDARRPAGVELYPGDRGRFLLLTGDVIDGRDTIEERTETLATLFPPAPLAAPRPSAPLTLDDDELLAKAFAAANGADLERLLAGDLNGHGNDHSAADLAAASKLAFWTQDEAQIARIIGGSALGSREKWQRRPDYRQRTIARALQRSEFYTAPGPPARSTPTGQDAPSAPDPCTEVRDEIAKLRAENAALKRQLAEQDATIDALRQVQSSGARILSNRSLGPSRVMAATLATQFAWRATAATPPGEIDAQPPPGMMRLSVAAGARLAGVSLKSAGTHFTALAERGIIRRKIETRLVTEDPDTGEILAKPDFRSVHFVGPANVEALTSAAAVQFAHDVARFTTERVENRGGKRVARCPDHPTAGVLREHIDRCAKCRRELGRDEGPLPAVALEPLPPERSAKFTDHTRTVALVSMQEKSADRSVPAQGRSAKFADRTRRAAAADLAIREPAYLADAPAPVEPPSFDVPPQPARFVVPDSPRAASSFHFEVAD